MKVLYKLLTVFLAGCLFAACEQEFEKNSGVTDPEIDPSKAPSGVITGDILNNLGTSAILSASVSNDNGSVLLDNGVIASTESDFTLLTKGVVTAAASTVETGNFEVRLNGLTKNTTYYYKAYSYNASGIAYGEVKSFQTANVTFTPYSTQFDPEIPSDIAEWVLDEFTGFDESGMDPVWFFNPADAGAPAAWGKSIAVYNGGEPDETYTISSPQFMIAENDELSFSFYIGLFGAAPTAKIKVYITEDLNDLGTPVKDWDLPDGGNTNISMAPYANKLVYVVWVVEQGDVFFYNFSIKPAA